jgi:outer membrane lipoprotein-sorting protein
MRRLAFALIFTGLALGLGGAAPEFRHEMSDADKADLDRVSASLNAIHTLKAAFVQIGPDGKVDEGMFYLDKPGRMRFEYAPPNPTLVVSDGSTVAVENKKLNTTDRYPIWSTPLNLILSNDVNLKKNPSIVGVDHQEGELVVSARSHSQNVSGNITLVFAEPGLELKQWTVIDAQGLTTTVSVRDVRQDVQLAPSLFTIEDQNPTKEAE